MSGVFIVAAKRTPFGTFGGTLRSWTATDLAVHSSRAALASANIDPKAVDSVIIGNVAQTSPDSAYLARHVGLKSGIPIEAPALTINRLCGSGFQSLINGAHEILLGESKIVLTGGSESMSMAPFSMYGDVSRWGAKLGAPPQLHDTLWSALTDSYTNTPMAITAENLAEKYNITREQCDEYALRSQTAWGTAHKEGRFKAEIEPIEIKSKKDTKVFDFDEHARPNSTIESIAKLPPVFKKNGTVSAGNASGISDGAASVIIASEDALKAHNLKPLARVVGYHVSGVEPTIMGIGPVPAIRGLLSKTGKKLEDIDLVEINEAFAAQYLSCEKELGLDRSKTNINGGAIALGHPLAASGSRILSHLTHELRRSNGKYAIGSACIGGGQGISVMLENCQ